jgi:hypothetical protein
MKEKGKKTLGSPLGSPILSKKNIEEPNEKKRFRKNAKKNPKADKLKKTIGSEKCEETPEALSIENEFGTNMFFDV